MRLHWIVATAAVSLLMYGCADAGMAKKEMAAEAPKAAAAKPAAEPKKAEKAEVAAAGELVTEAIFRDRILGKKLVETSGDGYTIVNADGTLGGMYKGKAWSGTWTWEGEDLHCMTISGRDHCNRSTIIGDTVHAERVTGRGKGRKSAATIEQ